MAVPRRSSIIAMRLFIFSLAVLFAASMLAYAAIRTGFFGSVTTPLGSLRSQLPNALFVSTALVLLASFSISRALACVRREKQRPFRVWLATTMLLAIAFVIVQAPSLFTILSEHFAQLRSALNSERRPMALLGLVFFLIVVHGLHVLGGIISLAWVTYRAGQNAYDHEHHMPIAHTAFYWHFLDVVWLVMFGTLYALG